jgi:N-acetylglucosaminyldiphosphoundecaprenol N-acetyl-beta-D-mannosaminyltransferase
MKDNRISILNIPVDNYTMDQTLNLIQSNIRANTITHHVVVNAAKLVNAQKDQELRESIINSDIINADGQSVVWASAFLGRPLKERVAGIDLMINLVEMAHKNGFKIFLLGATEEVLRKMVDKYTTEFDSALIAGYRNGYFKKEEEEEVARQIGESGAQLLFVAITSPKKEIFLNKYKNIIRIPFIMGVGGSFDVIAGKTKRAPVWMQKAGLEWFYRVAQEPRRMWKRYLVGNSAFIYLVIKEKWKQIFKKK